MKAVRPAVRFKNFCIGLGIAGVASIGAASGTQAQGGCTGSCVQCGTCCFGVLSLGLWLAEKRWKLIARTRIALARRSSRDSVSTAGFEGKEILK